MVALGILDPTKVTRTPAPARLRTSGSGWPRFPALAVCCDANGFGEAESQIGEVVVTVTNAGDDRTGQVSSSACQTDFFTAVPTGEQRNTSEESS